MNKTGRILLMIFLCLLAVDIPWCFSGVDASSIKIYNKELFLLAGHPGESFHLLPRNEVAPRSWGNPVTLYTIKEKGNVLITIKNVVSKKWGMEFTHYYNSKRVILIGQNHRPQFVKLDMDNPLKIVPFEIEYCDLCFAYHAHLLNMLSKGLYQSVDVDVDASKHKLYGMNLTTMQQEEFSWENYQHLQMSGMAGIDIRGSDWVYLLPEKDGTFTISLLGSENIKTSWHNPDKDIFKREKTINSASINNDYMLVVSSTNCSQAGDNNRLGTVKYYVFNKKLQNWDTVEFKGSQSPVHSFGDWIAGYVADVARDVDSPGKDARKKPTKPWEKSFDEKFRKYNTYSAGILFIYNMSSQKKYYINTGQGDNEVLLIDDGLVFYRACDSIYMAEIGEEQVGESTLLIKDDAVRNIHWAFTSPYYPIEKRPLSSKLGEFYLIGRDIYKWSGYAKKEFQNKLNDVYAYDFAKQEYRKVFDGGCYYQKLLLSDDGNYIGLLCTDGGAPHNLLVLDTKGKKELTLSEKIEDFIWLPDTNKIIYMTGEAIDYGDRREVTSTGIWLCDIKSGSKRRLAEQGHGLKRTRFDKHVYFSNGSGTVRYNGETGQVEPATINLKADYSPDGRYYLYSVNADDIRSPRKIYDTQRKKNVFADSLEDINARHPVYVEWGKNSQTLIFKGDVSQKNHEQRLYVYDLKAEKIVTTYPDSELVGFNHDRTSMVIYQDGKLERK